MYRISIKSSSLCSAIMGIKTVLLQLLLTVTLTIQQDIDYGDIFSTPSTDLVSEHKSGQVSQKTN